jgi:hypothetical protein
MIYCLAGLGDQTQSGILFDECSNLSLIPPALQGGLYIDVHKNNVHKSAHVPFCCLLLCQCVIDIEQSKIVLLTSRCGNHCAAKVPSALPQKLFIDT